MLTYEQLDEIKTRASKATAGPWDWNSRHGLGAPNRLVMWPSHEYGCDLDIEGEEADLDFIAHARTDIPDLLAALEASEAETLSVCNREAETIARYDDKLAALEQERDDWAKHLPVEIVEQGLEIVNCHKRIAALEQERDALKEALTNSCDLLESYIDTFGDMSGANRADLNDYRRALEAKS